MDWLEPTRRRPCCGFLAWFLRVPTGPGRYLVDGTGPPRLPGGPPTLLGTAPPGAEADAEDGPVGMHGSDEALRLLPDRCRVERRCCIRRARSSMWSGGSSLGTGCCGIVALFCFCWCCWCEFLLGRLLVSLRCFCSDADGALGDD